MSTTRVVAAGTRLFAQGGAEVAYAQVAAVVSIGGPDQSADSIDVTELDPYEGETTPTAPEFFKLFVAGWRDGGTVTLVLNMMQAGHQRIKDWFDKGYTVGFYIQLRNGMQQPFSAHITALGQTQEKDGLVTQPVSLKITGKVGLTTSVA